MSAWITDGANTYNGTQVTPILWIPKFNWGFRFVGVPTGHAVQLTVKGTVGSDMGSSTITICHATGSSSNPYVRLTISTSGLSGHSGHADDLIPDEYEYRYPGPRPRTKEAAILMIADACESAARAIGEPTPAKIESLVRDIATKRLRDGQFDDCELTLKELATIADSISRSLTSMHHVRVQYPGPATEEPQTQLASISAAK